MTLKSMVSQMPIDTIDLRDTHGNLVFRRLELPERDVDCYTTFTLSLELVKHPCYTSICEDKDRRRSGRNIKCVPYLKDDLPSSAASFSNFSMVLLSIPPHL